MIYLSSKENSSKNRQVFKSKLSQAHYDGLQVCLITCTSNKENHNPREAIYLQVQFNRNV